MNLKSNLGQLLLMFFISTTSLSGETFRVSKVHTAEITSSPNNEINVQLGINDSLAITLPENKEYLEGVELKFTIPEAVAYWMDSVACSIYENIKPTPKTSQIDYSGSRIFVRTLPNKLSWVLQIPLKKENSIKSNNYTQKLDKILNPENNIIFLRLQPVMKGVPDETLNSIIPITIKPILSNKGKLNLSLLPPDNKDLSPCSVFIDDEMISFPRDEDIYLPAGIHDISIISEAYRNELRTVRIDQARETDLIVKMKSIAPTIFVSAPEGTAVYLDNEEFSKLDREVEIQEGEHKIKVVIGNYEMVRTINAIKGKTYKAVFSLDLQITEE